MCPSYFAAEPVGSILIGPSITPWRNQMENFIGSRGINPSIRLIKYDRETGVTLDIEQYYLNLTEANLNGNAEWLLEYTGTTYYGQPDMSSDSLHKIVKKFIINDDGTFNKYYRANGVSYNTTEICDGECKYVLYCSATEVDYNMYEECIKGLIGGCSLLSGHNILSSFVALTLLLLNVQ